MPYYECPKCGGGYVIDPAPAHPVCDRDGGALKLTSEKYYEPAEVEEETTRAPRKRASKSRGR